MDIDKLRELAIQKRRTVYGRKYAMTAEKLISVLSKLPSDCRIISDIDWECESDILAIWYFKELNEAYLTQDKKEYYTYVDGSDIGLHLRMFRVYAVKIYDSGTDI